MNRIKYFIVALALLLITGNVQAMVLDEVWIIETSDDVTIKGEPKIEGLTIDLGARFSDVGNYVKLGVIIINDEDEERTIDENIIKENEDSYFSYDYSIDKKVLAKDEEAFLEITITYKEEVPASAFVNYMYVDTNSISLNFIEPVVEEPAPVDPGSNIDVPAETEEVNPQTADLSYKYYAILALSIVGLGGTIYLVIKTKKKQYLMVIVAILIIQVTTVHALEGITVKVNMVLEIEEYREFCVVDDFEFVSYATYPELEGLNGPARIKHKKCYRYTEGLTWKEYYLNNESDDDYDEDADWEDDNEYNDYIDIDTVKYQLNYLPLSEIPGGEFFAARSLPRIFASGVFNGLTPEETLTLLDIPVHPSTEGYYFNIQWEE